VAGASRDRGRLRTLKRLCEVARALGATIVAEGIESDDDLRALMDLGVDLGQGFLWGDPGRLPEA
jgi:EAL domain-containing protein (putative c-di-GMP-specific phosphodiesterase class I)